MRCYHWIKPKDEDFEQKKCSLSLLADDSDSGSDGHIILSSKN